MQPVNVNAAAPVSREFRRLDVPQTGYVTGDNLFPGRVIAGFNSDLDKYDADSWAAYIVEKCAVYETGCTAVSYNATNSGDTGGRFWFGYTFHGEATVDDFVKDKDDDIRDLRVYTRS